jgi:hypothetical protein
LRQQNFQSICCELKFEPAGFEILLARIEKSFLLFFSNFGGVVIGLNAYMADFETQISKSVHFKIRQYVVLGDFCLINLMIEFRKKK